METGQSRDLQMTSQGMEMEKKKAWEKGQINGTYKQIY